MIEVPLTKGYITLIDDIDGDLAELRWHADIGHSGVIYARRNQLHAGTWTIHRMHRIILERILGRPLLGGERCDHKDRNGVNNARENLRLATYEANAHNMVTASQNKSGSIGVSWNAEKRKWHARIGVAGKEIHLGFYTQKEEAIRIRHAAELAYWGEFIPDRSTEPFRALK